MSNMCRKISTIVLVLGCSYVFNVFATQPGQQDEYIVRDGDIAFPNDLKIGLARQSYQPHSHHHHHYHPYHHFHYHEAGVDDKEVTASDELGVLGTTNSDTNGSMQIPLEFIQKINQYNLSDLLLNYMEDGDDDSKTVLKNRFLEGDEGARDASVIPKPAGCQPELQTVKLAPTDDLSTFYYPACTRVERCGGCCSHALLSCQPEKTETLSFKLIKSKYKGGNKLSIVGKEIIQVEKHTKCKCDCIVRPEDCNLYQEYRKSECRCACKNTDEEKKCFKNNQTKLWNPNRCSCQCREVTECSTGTEFDQNECRCKPTLIRRRFADYTKNYKPEPPAVVPLDEGK